MFQSQTKQWNKLNYKINYIFDSSLLNKLISTYILFSKKFKLKIKIITTYTKHILTPLVVLEVTEFY
jgi:hypothetical protein